MLTFQNLIQKLTQFWAEKGCIVHQPHDVEKGAGTYNPASFLRCLGPEPYNTVYVEPSRRPQDGRYGQNPNRFQFFHQLQVVMKPSPIDIQQTYLKSLEHIGFDLSKHDIRFVHDDWESPTLGAWGLGWEVWMDGMEITQYTYFQAVGGIPTNPVCVELAYGLERIAMHLQHVNTGFEIKWNDNLTLSDISKQAEIEWSSYNFDEASVEMWYRHFNDYEAEANRLLEKNLPFPAYDFVLKATHAFNILESRRVLSVTERTGYIAKIRALSTKTASAYIQSRESQKFPLLKKRNSEKNEKIYELPKRSFNPHRNVDFLLEIGSEELPASFIPLGIQSLTYKMKSLLADHHLNFEDIHVYATPRRLSVLISSLAEMTEPKVIEKKGPPIQRAFDAKGKLTKQGKGFFKSLGISEDPLLDAIKQGAFSDIEIRGEYLFAKIQQEGHSAFDVLHKNLPSCILSLSFPKKMRWSDLFIEYPRPILWIVALLGEDIIPFELGNLIADRITYGHGQIDPKPIFLKSPQDYVKSLKEHYVLVDVEERKQEILRQLTHIEKKTHSIALKKQRVLNEVLHLVEWPELTVADFDPSFLKAPAEVLISEMVEHQRYFPLANEHGILKNAFVITANNHPNDGICRGNQRVLSARLSDGVFLYEQDVKIPLDTFAEKLKRITFQKDLGSMFDKVKRLTDISKILCMFIPGCNLLHVERAAKICKADLTTQLTNEFPELQGVIGKDYALKQGEEKEVADAIEEHWNPRFEGGPLPHTKIGSILSLADKIDNLIGYFSVGLKPSSSSDPYALRRQSLGFLKILIENTWNLHLPTFFEKAMNVFPKLYGELHTQKTLFDEISEYLKIRAKTVYEEYGFEKDEIEASLKDQLINPYDQYCRLKALSEFRKSGEAFSKLFEVYKRAKGQIQIPVTTPFNPKLLIEKQEKTLADEIATIEKTWESKLSSADYIGAFKLLATLQSPLADLFDHVKILHDDEKLRQNRLALLKKVFVYFSELLDFSKIQEIK